MTSAAAEFLTSFLDPGLSWLKSVPPGPTPTIDDKVRVLMLAIAGQESAWRNIQQSGDGEGMDPWQQQENNCQDILDNPATSMMASAVCAACDLPPDAEAVYANLLKNRNLVVAFARLNLWADPRPLPAVGDEEGAWAYYLACWMPGKPGPDRWPDNYQAAVAAMTDAPETEPKENIA